MKDQKEVLYLCIFYKLCAVNSLTLVSGLRGTYYIPYT